MKSEYSLWYIWRFLDGEEESDAEVGGYYFGEITGDKNLLTNDIRVWKKLFMQFFLL